MTKAIGAWSRNISVRLRLALRLVLLCLVGACLMPAAAHAVDTRLDRLTGSYLITQLAEGGVWRATVHERHIDYTCTACPANNVILKNGTCNAVSSQSSCGQLCSACT